MASKEMVGSEFRQNALRTEPTKEQYEKAIARLNYKSNAVAVIVKLNEVQKALEDLDQIKKYLFYGKESPFLVDFEEGTFLLLNTGMKPTVTMFVNQAKTLATPKNIRLLHGVTGLNTEGGELVEALLKVSRGENADTVNFMEEWGDCMWYGEVIGDTLGFTSDEAQVRVIEKLRRRFPDKFTEEDATNRNLDSERDALEGR